jgi:hypothetical protein
VEEITSALLAVDDRELIDEITTRLRALRLSGPVSVDGGRGRVLEVLQPYIDDLTWRKERGARRAAADTAAAVMLGLYECRADTEGFSPGVASRSSPGTSPWGTRTTTARWHERWHGHSGTAPTAAAPGTPD